MQGTWSQKCPWQGLEGVYKGIRKEGFVGCCGHSSGVASQMGADRYVLATKGNLLLVSKSARTTLQRSMLDFVLMQ